MVSHTTLSPLIMISQEWEDYINGTLPTWATFERMEHAPIGFVYHFRLRLLMSRLGGRPVYRYVDFLYLDTGRVSVEEPFNHIGEFDARRTIMLVREIVRQAYWMRMS